MGFTTLGGRVAACVFAVLVVLTFFVAASSAGRDKKPPSVPTNLTVSAVTSTGFTVSWTASTDHYGVAGYDLWLNGSSAGTTPATSRAFSGLACGTRYTVEVDAYDTVGNYSARVSVGATTAACAGTAPTNTSPPAISGTAVVGQTLTALEGAWSGSTPIRYTYQWWSCDLTGAACAAIANPAGTVKTYTLVVGDKGRTFRVQVTASNGAGSSSATSALTGVVQAAPTPTPSPAGLHVSGNQLLDSNGKVVRLHGVNRAGTEYACVQGWGIFDGPTDAASVSAIGSWNANVVHIGLNEDCVLGINGVPAAYSGAVYLNAVVAYVTLLHAQGLYAEVSLMWAAPGTQRATGHPLILDQDHSADALRAIANAFKNDPNTFIGLESEPHGIGWPCYLNGGSSCSVGYAALGMQAALNAVRSTGATNVVTMSGIDYANNLSQWLQYKPNDPQGQLIAEAHIYGKNVCSTVSCFDSQIAPVAAQVPVVYGEAGETYDDSSCGSSNISTIMGWADQHGIGYEAWTWDTWGTCGSLISNYNGTPANAYGTWVKNHYATLP
jgi:endoglucanase